MLVKNSVCERVSKFIDNNGVADDLLFMIHGDNSVSILLDQRRINRIKLTDREMYDRLNERGNGFYCTTYEQDNGEVLTILRSTTTTLGIPDADLSQKEIIELGIEKHLSGEDYLKIRNKDTANKVVVEVIDALLKVKM